MYSPGELLKYHLYMFVSNIFSIYIFVVNGWNYPGACGYIPWFARPFYPVALIKVDENTNEPIRGPDGLCIPCETGM